MQPEKPKRQRRRKHFISDWMKQAGVTNADVIEATGAGKDLVSKWKNQGMVPTVEYLNSLADLFGVTPEALFRPPLSPSPAPLSSTRAPRKALLRTESEIKSMLRLIERLPNNKVDLAYSLLEGYFSAESPKQIHARDRSESANPHHAPEPSGSKVR